MTNHQLPWEAHPDIWKTKAAFMVFLRGGLRRVWNKHPAKLALLKRKRMQIPNPNENAKKATVWGAECSVCLKIDVLKNMQIDHITPAGSIVDISDIQGFVERLLVVSSDNLRVVCNECNSILAYADKYNVSYENAKSIKQAIRIVESKQDKQWLIDRGVTPASSKEKRRTQIENILALNVDNKGITG